MSDTKFCHYTTIDNARNILRGGSFYMSEMSQMNDVGEADKHKEKSGTLFVNCFCHSEAKNIPMFYLYGGIDGKGCRVEFTESRLKKLVENCQVYPVNDKCQMLKQPFDGSEYEIACDWIYYMTPRGFYKYKNTEVLPLETYEATIEKLHKEGKDVFIKDYIWRYENEYRILVRFKNPIKYKRVAIKFDIGEKERGISMMCGPETEDVELTKIQEEFRNYGIMKITRPNKMGVRMGLVEKNRRLYK